MSKLNHFDEKGNAIMVDVSDKAETERIAVAAGRITVSREVYTAVAAGIVKKGDVLGTARVAGILATKQTPHLIPMCHPLLLTHVAVDFEMHPEIPAIDAFCTAKLKGKTGVEMEALTGVSTALLTIYDMCKALDKGMVISDIRLLEKSGGKSGHYIREEDRQERTLHPGRRPVRADTTSGKKTGNKTGKRGTMS